MIWFRIDNRLVHGQIIEAWLPHLNTQTLVVLNDDLAQNCLQQEIMKLAIPDKISVFFLPVSEGSSAYEKVRKNTSGSALFLLANCMDALRLAENGVFIPILNVGNIHYAPGKEQMFPNIAVSVEEKSCLMRMESGGTNLDFRSIPSDMPYFGGWNA